MSNEPMWTDEDEKYIKGFVDIKSTATSDFSKLQFDLARKMKLNRVQYLDKNLKTSRNKDAVFVEFPFIKKGENFTFRIYYEGKPLITPSMSMSDGSTLLRRCWRC